MLQTDECVVEMKRDKGRAELGEAGLICKGKRGEAQEASSKDDDDGRVGPDAGGGLEPR